MSKHTFHVHGVIGVRVGDAVALAPSHASGFSRTITVTTEGGAKTHIHCFAEDVEDLKVTFDELSDVEVAAE